MSQFMPSLAYQIDLQLRMLIILKQSSQSISQFRCYTLCKNMEPLIYYRHSIGLIDYYNRTVLR